MDYEMHGMRFDGPEYNPVFDRERLSSQLLRVYRTMKDGQWRTLREIAQLTNDPPASVSARLRDLRKPRFGSYVVERRARGDRGRGLFEYRLLVAEDGL